MFDEICDEIINKLKTDECVPILLSVSGSDAYGFSSINNSDIDIRGFYMYVNPIDVFNPGTSAIKN